MWIRGADGAITDDPVAVTRPVEVALDAGVVPLRDRIAAIDGNAIEAAAGAQAKISTGRVEANLCERDIADRTFV